jgi:hypothetical protein
VILLKNRSGSPFKGSEFVMKNNEWSPLTLKDVPGDMLPEQ